MANSKQPRTPFKITSKKKASTPLHPSPEKTARAYHSNSNDERPSWRFSKLELVDPFGWHILSSTKLHEIRSKIQNFESMTWNEILIEAKKQNHSISTEKICRAAQNRLCELELDDAEDLISLRIGARERIWGIRQSSVLLLLWWDPDHQICPSTLKHT